MEMSGYEPKYDYRKWGDVAIHRDNCYDYAFNDDERLRNSKSIPGDRSLRQFPNSNFTTCKGFVARVLADNPRRVYKCTDVSLACKKGYYKVMGFVAPTNIYGDPTGDFHWYRQNKSVRYRVRPGDTLLGISRFFRVSPATVQYAIIKGKKPTSRDDGFIADPGMHINMKQYGLKLKKTGMVITIPVNAWSHKQGWATGPLLVDASGNLIRDPRKANRRYGYNYSRLCSAFCVKRTGIKTGKP
jgi:hypothetical protein